MDIDDRARAPAVDMPEAVGSGSDGRLSRSRCGSGGGGGGGCGGGGGGCDENTKPVALRTWCDDDGSGGNGGGGGDGGGGVDTCGSEVLSTLVGTSVEPRRDSRDEVPTSGDGSLKITPKACKTRTTSRIQYKKQI